MILANEENIKKYTQMGIYSDKTLMDLLKGHVAKNPDNICISDPLNKKDLLGTEPERLSYRDFDKAVDSMSKAFVKKGLKKDDTVLVQMPNCWELAMLYLAVGKAGGIISPVPTLWRESELTYVANHLDIKYFITVNEFAGFKHKEVASNLKTKNLFDVLLYEDLKNMISEDNSEFVEFAPVCSDDILTICWTSGTESNPKGCPLSHNNWAGMSKVQESAGMMSGDKFLTAGPLVNMASIGTVFAPWLVFGGQMILHHPFDPALFIQQIMEEKPDYTLLVPAVANMIAKHPNVDSFDLSSFRSITLGSAPPSIWTMEEFKRRWDIDIANIWGQNEGSGFIAGLDDIPDMEKRATSFPFFSKSGTNFKSSAADCVELKILDPMGEELTGNGDIGELVFQGPGLFAGYYKNIEITQRSFTPDGFFKTGDLFRIDGDYLIFHERAKDIIIRGGYNISSQEVENYILSHPEIREAAVVSMPDEKLGEKMCVYVVPVDSNEVTLESIIALLTEKGVARYKHPERVEVIDQIPRNPVGKILKKELRKDILKRLSS